MAIWRRRHDSGEKNAGLRLLDMLLKGDCGSDQSDLFTR
jgi:hypothetical protein